MRYFLYLNGYKMKATLNPVVIDLQNKQYIPRKLKSTSQRIIVELVEELVQPEVYNLEYEEVLEFIQQNTAPIPKI